jgi:Ca-activated chloride channel family protein
MNRTVAFISLAGGLALLALVLAVPPAAPSDPPRPPVVVKPPPPAPPPTVPPSGSLALEGRLSHPAIGTGRSEVFLSVGVRGAEVPGIERAPVNAALVIDRSGSMAGEKLAHAKEAALQFVSQLREADRVAIVHYGSDVRVFRGAQATPENRSRMAAFIRRIQEDGGTNIGDGLETGSAQLLAAKEEFKVNRIILLSDGQPTEGLTSPDALFGVASRIRRHGMAVSAIGIGTDFNEDLMQGIAERGSGAYGYLRDGSRLATLFQKDLDQAGKTVARNVELSFELPEGVELAEVLGYSHRRAGRTVRVPLTDFSAGQVERVVARLSVTGTEVGKSVQVARLQLSYTDVLADRPAETVATLAAEVTDRNEEIASRQDKDVAVFAARARAAVNVQRAADALARGDFTAANRTLRLNDAIYGSAAAVASPEAVAADVAAQGKLEARFSAAPAAAPEEVQHEVKAAKAKALRDFGRMGSTY